MSEQTFAALIAARGDDDHVALWFEERSWTWREVVAEAARRAVLLRRLRARSERAGGVPEGAPQHVGVFCENTAEHLFWWLGIALGGFTYVGINPTRRGPDLAADIAFTHCFALVVDAPREPLLEGVSPLPPVMVRVDSEQYAEALAGVPDEREALIAAADQIEPERILSLIFTSGTTSRPKAVICTQGRMRRIASQQAERRGLTSDETFYVVMPMFHSNALMAGIAPATAVGGTVVLRRKFSASAFLPDVRKYGVTFFNYVGKPLNYVLATPEQPDDADNPLRVAFGNEASERDIAEFSRRFGCEVIDAFGSSEGEIRINRVPGMPRGSLGVAPEGIVVMNPETHQECPRAIFDAEGRLLNGDEAIGEIVHTQGAILFEGYYNNPEADSARVRDGMVWSGDLAYRDAEGWWFFAGRNSDWLRVDGENLAAAPIERLLGRFEAFASVAVVAVPDEVVGDQVLAVVELAPGAVFDAEAFSDFLSTQPDLGTKWAPRYLRIVDALPRTATSKIIKRSIDTDLSDAAGVNGQLWRRTGTGLAYEPSR